MPHAEVKVPLKISWGATHRSGEGVLISQQVSVEAPSWPACNCLFPYLWALVKFVVLQMYHRHRVQYATRKRWETIPDHLRTGENAPQSVWGLLYAGLLLHLRR